MTLDKLCPKFKQEWRRKKRARWKAITTELAWRQHEKAQGIRQRESFDEAVRKIDTEFSA